MLYFNSPGDRPNTVSSASVQQITEPLSGGNSTAGSSITLVNGSVISRIVSFAPASIKQAPFWFIPNDPANNDQSLCYVGD